MAVFKKERKKKKSYELFNWPLLILLHDNYLINVNVNIMGTIVFTKDLTENYSVVYARSFDYVNVL